MTKKKLEANRMNALKSTGPRTRIGKAASSRNAVKHGVLSTTPILLAKESRKAWEEHRDGIFKSIAPVGYLEELLTFQIAEHSWRLGRISRYEAENFAAAGATMNTDPQQRDENGYPLPSEPEWARLRVRGASAAIGTFEALPQLSDEETLDAESIAATLWALCNEFSQVKLEDLRFSWPPGGDSKPDQYFDSSTVAFLRRVIERYANAVGIGTEAVRNRCVSSALKNRSWATEKERELIQQSRQRKLLLEAENQSRMQARADLAIKLARYESTLQRAFLRNLHEIQRLQASRFGVFVPPPAAVDVDVSVHPESSSWVHSQRGTRSRTRGKQNSTR